jgi:hypothetical protein
MKTPQPNITTQPSKDMQIDASKELLKKANDYADAFKLKFPNGVKVIASETIGDETNLDDYVGLSYMHTQGSQVSITVVYPALKQGEKLKEKKGYKLEASGSNLIDAHRDWLKACYEWFNALQDNGNRQGFLFGDCGVPTIENKENKISFSSQGTAFFKP